MLRGHDFLSQCLLEEQMITAEALEAAKQHSAEHDVSLEESLVAGGCVTARDLALARSILCECPFVDLQQYDIDINNARRLPRSIAEKYSAFPLFDLDEITTVGMADPLNLGAIDQLRQILKTEIDPVLCMPEALSALIHRAYSLSHGREDVVSGSAGIEELEVGSAQEPTVAAVNQIIADAIALNASDIHISPCESELQLRYRVDGELRVQQSPPLSSHPAIVQRLKVMSHLDLTQTRRPQDGKFRFAQQGDHFEVRISLIPTVCGENVVLRLLRSNGQILDFAGLGMAEEARDHMEQLLPYPHGMILVTGPTGSGKTCTLYSVLKILNRPNVNIVTIEDPVEIRMHGVRQVQTNAEIGLTFATALRSILRQDPDVVLVGEIRDQETALIATQASLTGHLVLSTLHTNDAAGAVARLRDLGVAPFVINSSLLGIVAQRLVKRVCRDCAKPHKPDRALLRRFGIKKNEGSFVHGLGCARCHHTGYRGRVGIFEVFRMTPEIAVRIDAGATTQELTRLAAQSGMKPMWRDGLDKARAGITTLEEVAAAAATIDLHEDEAELKLSA